MDARTLERRALVAPSDSGLSRLAIGDIVTIDATESEYVVTMVNDCRAVVCPATDNIKMVTDHDGRIRYAGVYPHSISPNSLVPILRRMGEAGLRLWLDVRAGNASLSENGTTKTKTMTKTKQKLAAPGPKIKNPRGGLAAEAAAPTESEVNAVKEQVKTAESKPKPAPAPNKAKADGKEYPANAYDRALYEEVEKGGTKADIVKRVCARFKDEPNATNRQYRTNPKNAEKWLPEIIEDMKAEGFDTSKVK